MTFSDYLITGLKIVILKRHTPFEVNEERNSYLNVLAGNDDLPALTHQAHTWNNTYRLGHEQRNNS